MATVHNEANKNDIAKTVLMSGDPLRVKFIADNYLTNVKLVNKVRNMYAYTGLYKGKEITVMAHGMGIPSAGIYTYELFKFYDVENIIRLGTAGSYNKDINLNDIVLVKESYSDSMYAKSMDNMKEDIFLSSNDLNDKLIKTAKEKNINLKEIRVHSTDAFYTTSDIYDLMREKYKCDAVEMETFALFVNAKLFNKNASCLLTISDSLITKEELSSSDREKTLNKMIEVALDSVLLI